MMRSEDVQQELVQQCGFTNDVATEFVNQYSDILRRFKSVKRATFRIVRLERQRRNIPPDWDFPKEMLND